MMNRNDKNKRRRLIENGKLELEDVYLIFLNDRPVWAVSDLTIMTNRLLPEIKIHCDSIFIIVLVRPGGSPSFISFSALQ